MELPEDWITKIYSSIKEKFAYGLEPVTQNFMPGLKRYGNVESSKRDDILRKLREHPSFVKESDGGMWIGYRKNEAGRIRMDNNGKPIISKTKGIELDLKKVDLDLPEIDWTGNVEIPEEEKDSPTKQSETAAA